MDKGRWHTGECDKMKLKEIYELAVHLGMENDPRGRKELERVLKQAKEEEKECREKKKEFDSEKLKNPYADTRILYGKGDEEIKRALVGIDVEVSEILLADRLSEKGNKIDLVISHHPSGSAYANFFDVMWMQADIMAAQGVPINVAEGMLTERIKEVERRVMPANHQKSVDASRLLGIPFMCMHTVADNCVNSYLQKLMDRKKPVTLKDVLDILKEIPEYKEGAKMNAGPKIIVGSEKRRAGKVMVDMTGGTSGSKSAIERLSQAGVGTLLCMHIPDEHKKEAEKFHINVIIAGHMSSDSIGMNMIMDALEKKGIEIVPCAGYIRHSRNSKK